jgi:hypothetical protein
MPDTTTRLFGRLSAGSRANASTIAWIVSRRLPVIVSFRRRVQRSGATRAPATQTTESNPSIDRARPSTSSFDQAPIRAGGRTVFSLGRWVSRQDEDLVAVVGERVCQRSTDES